MKSKIKTNVEINKEDKKGNDDCCAKNNKKEGKGFWSGLLYGILPHTGCIAFIIFTILGVTAATSIFRPLLLNRYFFYILIAMSFVFATISAAIYLRRSSLLSFSGVKRKWKYLSVLYGTAIGINLLLFMVIFPIAANMTAASPDGKVAATGTASESEILSELSLKVGIPCPGHAPLITQELKTINGVESVNFRFPNYFDVSYSSKTTKEEILGLSVFKSYPAALLSNTEGGGEASKINTETPVQNQQQGCSVCGGCSGTCGG